MLKTSQGSSASSVSPDPLASGASSISPDPLASGASSVSPDPLASDASSASPDPFWARVQTPPRPSFHLVARLLTHDDRTSDVMLAITPMLRQGTTATPPCCGRARRQLFQPLQPLCSLTSFTVKYRLIVKEGMEEVNPCHYGCLFLTITGHAAVSLTRPP